MLFEAYPSNNNMSITFDGNATAWDNTKTPPEQVQVPRFSAATQSDANVTVTRPIGPGGHYYDVKVAFHNNNGSYYWYMTSHGTGLTRTWRFVTPIYGPVP